MKFTDERGRELTPDQVRAKGYGHLLSDTMPLRCSKCNRRGITEWKDKPCKMRQPHGSQCDGVFHW